MSNYLVLHVDTEFIAGVIYTGNGQSYPIKNSNEELLWLYFFNDPHQGRLTFGKDNKKHFNNLELNYYGDFFNLIGEEHETFTLRGNQRPIIELLEYSGLLALLQHKYEDVTLEVTSKIPTLITFSSTISNSAKVKTVDYFNSKNFKIESYTIPLAELISYHYWKDDVIKAQNGKSVLFLKATNSTLHLMKLTFTDGYFLKDESTAISYKGKGHDPRKKSIVRFVVTEVNKSTGVLTTSDEIEKECDRFVSSADEWLQRVDSNNGNRPVNIRSVSLSLAPSMQRDILVRKEDIESDTGYYINELEDIYNSFEKDCLKDRSSIAAVILFGDCFNNQLIRKKFKTHVDSDHLIISTSIDLLSVLPAYPTIDIKRYADAETRIKLQAIAENDEKKHLHESLLRKEKEQEAELIKLEELKKIEKNKLQAIKYFEAAKELDKQDKLLDAIANIENAKELDPLNKDILTLFDTLMLKKIELDIVTKQYKKLVSEASKLIELGELADALNKYELAKTIYDNPELRNIIVSTKTKIKESENKTKLLQKLIDDADKYINQKKYIEAKAKIEDAINIDSNSDLANNKFIEIKALLKIQEVEFNKFVIEADNYFSKGEYEKSETSYNKALVISPGDKYCNSQLSGIIEARTLLKKNKEVYDKIIEQASDFYANGEWEKAKIHFQKALSICPGEKYPVKQISECGRKLIAIEEKFQSLVFDADSLLKKGEKREALNLFEEAFKIQPGNKDLKSKISKLEFELDDWSDNDKVVKKKSNPLPGGTLKGRDKNNTEEKEKESDKEKEIEFQKAFEAEQEKERENEKEREREKEREKQFDQDFFGGKSNKEKKSDDFFGSGSSKKNKPDDFLNNKNKANEDDFLFVKKDKKSENEDFLFTKKQVKNKDDFDF
jgi:hypothetical protein